MKMITAIINKRDAGEVCAALTEAGYYFTRMASTGGFLMSGNTTFLICTDDENVDQVIRLIGDHSKKRKQMVSSTAGYGLGSYSPFPVEVTVGGATIIVTDVQRFEKL